MNKQGPQGIGWCDYTWNIVSGCWGPGGTAEKPNRCPYCYAKGISGRFIPFEKSGYVRIKMQCMNNDPFQPLFWPERLNQPGTVKKPSKIFVCSMGDLFGDWVPSEWIVEVLDTVRGYAWHTYQFLTKNPKRLKEFNPWPRNAWVGTTVTNQDDADERVPWLVQVDAAVRFVSAEPMLGPIDLRKYVPGPCFYCGHKHWNTGGKLGRHCCFCDKDAYYPGVNWLIIGAQTGPKAAKPDSAWVQSLIDQCRAAGVPCFVKDSLYKDFPIREWPR